MSEVFFDRLLDVTGTRVAVVGMGRSGTSSYRLLSLLGDRLEKLDAYDDGLPNYPKFDFELIEEKGYSSLVVSPGIPLGPFKSRVPEYCRLLNDIDISSFFIDHETIISVTGSVGKSTTTALLGSALNVYFPNVFAGGNLGTPLSDYIYHKVTKGRSSPYLCVELSSFHLENIHYFTSDYSIITYLLPNHLERYASLEEYYRVKFQLLPITRHQLFLNKRGGDLLSFWMQHQAELTSESEKTKVVLVDPADLKDFPFHKAKLIGKHNQQNIAMVYAVLSRMLPDRDWITPILDFPGLPHRQEYVTNARGIIYINDSKATTTESVLQAVHNACDLVSQGTVHLLLGGRDKNLDWERLSSLGQLPRVKIYFFGEARHLIQKKSGLVGDTHPSLSDLLSFLKSKIKTGDLVLLSPGGTSHDEFRSFEERGDFFKSWVHSLS